MSALPSNLIMMPAADIHPGVTHLKKIFVQGDTIHICLLHSTRKYESGDAVQERLAGLLEDIATPERMAWLQAKNDEGWQIYLAMNPLNNGEVRRKKFNTAVDSLRAVFLEFDKNVTEGLAKLRDAISTGFGDIPEPHIVLRSSRGKVQVIWLINAATFDVGRLEGLNEAMQKQFGADPASVDVLRLLRVPGFRNVKPEYGPDFPTVVVQKEHDGPRYDFKDFDIEVKSKAKRERGEKVSGAIPQFKMDKLDEYLNADKVRAELGVNGDWKPWMAENGDPAHLSELEICPAASEHTQGPKGASIKVFDHGAVDFSCLHTSCKKARRNWDWFKNWYHELTGVWIDLMSPEERAAWDAKNLASLGPAPMSTSQPSVPSFSSIPASVRPVMAPEAYYGLAGKIILKLAPQTESDPAGNLLEFLSNFGSIIGRTAYFEVEKTQHNGNIFIVRVGRTSKSRKGSGGRQIEWIFKQIDPVWDDRCISGGFGSGEKIIYDIRDDRQTMTKDRKTGALMVEVEKGVDDKRLHIREGEFSSVLVVAKRPDCILSKILRNGWDGKKLQNNVKGSPSECREPHLSCSGDITTYEVHLDLSQSDRANGFANRILWTYVDRCNYLPEGGEDLDWTAELEELRSAVDFAKSQRRMFKTDAARKLWARNYRKLSEGLPGIVGNVTSRGEAQTMRLALLFALLDKSDHIDAPHIEAALAVWQYCEDSARFIFGGGMLKEHIRVLEHAGDWTSMTDFREKLFQKHLNVAEIKVLLDHCVAQKKMTVETRDGVETWKRIGGMEWLQR